MTLRTALMNILTIQPIISTSIAFEKENAIGIESERKNNVENPRLSWRNKE